MEDLRRLLEEHQFLKGLSTEQTRVLVTCVDNKRYREGEFLLREGQAADVFYLLRLGRVALEIDVPGRGPMQMESLGPHDVLGISSLVPPHREHLDARVVEPVVALTFDGACLRGKMQADPALGYALTARMLAEAYKRLERVRLQRLDVYAGA